MNNLGQEGAKQISQFLEKESNLECLDLRRNHFLTKKNFLFNFSNEFKESNHFGDSGANLIFQALRRNKNLKEINLGIHFFFLFWFLRSKYQFVHFFFHV